MSQPEDLSVKGSPLQPHDNPKAKQTKKRTHIEFTADEAHSSSSHVPIGITFPVIDDQSKAPSSLPTDPSVDPPMQTPAPSPTDSTKSIDDPNDPTANLVAYYVDDSPEMIGESYVNALHVINITHSEGTLSPIQQCPFILAHLQPSTRIIPFVPLYLPSVPGYFFYLLYVLQETIQSTSAEQSDYSLFTAVFLMMSHGQFNRPPSIVGTGVLESYVKEIQVSIRREVKKLRDHIIQSAQQQQVERSTSS